MKTLFMTLAFVTLISCNVTADYTETSTLVLCDGVLNLPTYNIYRTARLEELAKRGEDCSEYTHLIQVKPTQQNINVDVQQNQ